MYQAKQQGRDRVCMFDDSLDDVRMRSASRSPPTCVRALATDGLTLVYQPVFDADDGLIVSVEALVRWPRGDDGSRSRPPNSSRSRRRPA